MKLVKGMSKEKVNSLLIENGWSIRLEDEFYRGNNSNHKWKCECGNIIEDRCFSKIRERNNEKCKICTYAKKEQEYKEMVEVNADYKYIKSYRSGDITENGIHVKDTPYIKIRHIPCGREYVAPAASFKQGKMRCTCAPYENSISYLCPEISEMIYCDENRNIIDNESKKFIHAHSSIKVYFKCSKCGVISSKTKQLSSVVDNGYSCEFCSDGIDMPEKFMLCLLKSLKIEYKYNTSYQWSDGKRYDFELTKYNYILETHGIQHYEESPRGRSLKEEKANDEYKEKLAKDKGYKYIVIDCRKTSLKWFKTNIINELATIFDLSKVEWDKLWKESQKSFVIKAWELNKDGYKIQDIADELSLTTTTIRKYLKLGQEIDEISEYNEKKRKVICLNNMRIFNSLMEAGLSIGVTQKEMYRCCNSKNKQLGMNEQGEILKWMYYDEYLNSDEEVFKNSVEAAKKYNLADRNIRSCCYGKRNYCGKLEEGTELKWMFLSVWEKMSQDEQYEKVNEKRKVHGRKVKCTTTNEIFNSISEAAERYKIERSNIISCCKGKRNYCGKLKDGTCLK